MPPRGSGTDLFGSGRGGRGKAVLRQLTLSFTRRPPPNAAPPRRVLNLQGNDAANPSRVPVGAAVLPPSASRLRHPDSGDKQEPGSSTRPPSSPGRSGTSALGRRPWTASSGRVRTPTVPPQGLQDEEQVGGRLQRTTSRIADTGAIPRVRTNRLVLPARVAVRSPTASTHGRAQANGSPALRPPPHPRHVVDRQVHASSASTSPCNDGGARGISGGNVPLLRRAPGGSSIGPGATNIGGSVSAASPMLASAVPPAVPTATAAVSTARVGDTTLRMPPSKRGYAHARSTDGAGARSCAGSCQAKNGTQALACCARPAEEGPSMTRAGGFGLLSPPPIQQQERLRATADNDEDGERGSATAVRAWLPLLPGRRRLRGRVERHPLPSPGTGEWMMSTPQTTTRRLRLTLPAGRANGRLKRRRRVVSPSSSEEEE